MRSISGALVAGTLIACACAAPAGAPPTPAAAPTLAVSGTPRQPPITAGSPPATVASPSPSNQAQPAIDAALRTAAQRLSISQADVKVERVEARQWSDASLGCPQQGVLYAQVLTPGFLIVVSGAGKQLEYHSDERGRVVLCAER